MGDESTLSATAASSTRSLPVSETEAPDASTDASPAVAAA
jgi:hypothetical protein